MISECTEAINSENDTVRKAELYFLRGKAYWRMGKRQPAVVDYAEAVASNPESPARLALEHAGDIEDFFNPDLLNP